VKVKKKDEVLPHLFVHTINDFPTQAFVKKLAEGEAYQN
jgi:hypothetical protein